MAFPNNCNPRLITVDGSTGCTLTRANIRGMTPQDFEDQGFKEIGMDRIIARSQEARLAGVSENTLESLLMSRVASIKGALTKQNISGQGSVILPYIYRRQKRNINVNYWKITAGTATPGAGTGDVHPGSWDFTIAVHGGSYATALTDVYKYFIRGMRLFVETKNASTHVAYSLQYEITASAAVSSTTAKVTVKPNYTTSGWNALSGAQQAVFQPTTGQAVIMSNSVSDYESWGGQFPAENANKVLTYWLQTERQSFEYNDEYLKALNAALTSNYFKDFRQLPLAEQRRINAMRFRTAFLNTAFYGQRENENQTVENYRSLPSVVDPANPSCVLEYKSSALGFETQLSDCSRIYDHQNAALDIDLVASTGYDLKRSREADGSSVDCIDWMTDRHTAGAINDMMMKFYKAKYGVNIERHYQPNQKLTFEDQVMLQYNRYQLPPDLGGYDFAVFWHPYFDDKLSAFDTAVKSRGRAMWGLDWTDILLGIAGSNSVQRKTNEADELYKYVMKINAKHVMLESTTFSPIIEDPNRHYIIRNFSGDCPKLTVPSCDLQGA